MSARKPELNRLVVLDGWRALSISLVMAGHLMPIGPSKWGLNGATAATGMVLFFTLSGFLITRFLAEDGDVRRFLIRRILRIVPLAWAGAVMAYLLGGGTLAQLFGTMAFVANIPPFPLLPAGGHFWSLSLEVQFYGMVAILVALAGRHGLRLLPVVCLVITLVRINAGQYMNITTWFRIDEILAGSTLALAYEGWLGNWPRQVLTRVSPVVLLPLVVLSAHPASGPLNYLRPYLSAAMVGASLYNAPQWLTAVSASRVSRYIAATSFALYVFHGMLVDTWLGSGDHIVKYAKRPLFLLVTFGLAHMSTFHFERRWIDLSRRLTARRLEAARPSSD